VSPLPFGSLPPGFTMNQKHTGKWKVSPLPFGSLPPGFLFYVLRDLQRRNRVSIAFRLSAPRLPVDPLVSVPSVVRVSIAFRLSAPRLRECTGAGNSANESPLPFGSLPPGFMGPAGTHWREGCLHCLSALCPPASAASQAFGGQQLRSAPGRDRHAPNFCSRRRASWTDDILRNRLAWSQSNPRLGPAHISAAPPRDLIDSPLSRRPVVASSCSLVVP